jgi:hypothetical protein
MIADNLDSQDPEEAQHQSAVKQRLDNIDAARHNEISEFLEGIWQSNLGK